jgi:tetratricopeptide (TPR) repeat protein
VTSAARRALELDSTLADARTALGTAYAFDGQWTDAEREFRHALALEPDNLAAHLTFGRNLVCRGRSAEALAQFQAARKVERMSAVVSAWTAYAMAQIGQLDSALAESDRAVQLDSTLLPTTNLGAFINLTAGRPDVAVRLVAGETPPTIMSTAPYVYARVGDTATATRLLHARESHRPRPWFTDASQAAVMLALGDTARALDALERSAAATGGGWTALLPISEQVFDQLRRSARFIALERRAGLDQQIIASPTGGRRASPLATARPGA